jgi:hypothetical protein
LWASQTSASSNGRAAIATAAMPDSESQYERGVGDWRDIFQIGEAQAVTKRLTVMCVRDAEMIRNPLMAVRAKLDFTREINSIGPSR